MIQQHWVPIVCPHVKTHVSTALCWPERLVAGLLTGFHHVQQRMVHLKTDDGSDEIGQGAPVFTTQEEQEPLQLSAECNCVKERGSGSDQWSHTDTVSSPEEDTQTQT